jgi:hypothetical protein
MIAEYLDLIIDYLGLTIQEILMVAMVVITLFILGKVGK